MTAKTVEVTHVKPHATWGAGKEQPSGWPGTDPRGCRAVYDDQQAATRNGASA